MFDDQRRAFLDEVVANPDDDTPRLIYADYLEETGDPRGELIRLQCELAYMHQLDPRYLDTLHRCDELLEAHEQTWAAELKQDVRKAQFHRGFIDTITIRGRAFLKEGDSLYRDNPVHWLRFNYLKGVGPALASLEALRKIRCLDLADLTIPADDLIALLTSPYLDSLTALKLGGSEQAIKSIGRIIARSQSAKTLESIEVRPLDGFLGGLASGEGFPVLKSLNVNVEYSDQSVRDIGKLNVPMLESLTISGNLSDSDARAITALPLAQIERVSLRSYEVEGETWRILADAGALRQVEDLGSLDYQIDRETARAIFRDGNLARCKVLRFWGPRYTAGETCSVELLDALSRHTAMTSLRELRLSHLDHSDLARIAQSPVLANLESLALESSRFNHQDMEVLAGSSVRTSLRQLSLLRCDLDEILAGFVSTTFPNLLRLDFGDIGFYSVGQEFVTRLLRSDAFPKLQWLGLGNLGLSADTLMILAKESHLPELRELDFQGNRLLKANIAAIMESERLPKLSRMWVSRGARVAKWKETYGSRLAMH